MVTEPAFCPEAKLHQHKHDGHLDQNPDHRCERDSRRQTEEHGCRCDGYLEVIRRPDHGRGRGVGITQAKAFRREVPQDENETGLDEKRDRNPENGEGIGQDNLPFE